MVLGVLCMNKGIELYSGPDRISEPAHAYTYFPVVKLIIIKKKKPKISRRSKHAYDDRDTKRLF